MGTHDVFNQPPPLQDYDLYAADVALREMVERCGVGWADTHLHDVGTLAGQPDVIQWGFDANVHRPVLHTHDRVGHRRDEVVYHPAYHHLMREAVAHGMHAAPWATTRRGTHVARAAAFSMWMQVDAGHGCPISMTYSIVPALRAAPELAAEWEPLLVSRRYDERFAPAGTKTGITAGMGMTEKQGGSDVRANTTRAVPTGDGYHLTGHKWFCSAPMSDVFLMLAQAPGGLSCFLVPRWQPDGTPNALALVRLKDKMGNHSNASGEIELDRAWARLVGEEGRGVRTIIEMVNHTRLDCVIGIVATMRQALVQAIHHTRHRRAFGALLVDQPLMTAVLADLVVEVEATVAMMGRLAQAYDDQVFDPSPSNAGFRRLATAVGKYWACKRCPPMVAEALECLGGNGYIEESILPRLFRESPLNGVWEGSGNVICLEVLRAIEREPAALDAFCDELVAARGADPRYDAFLNGLQAELADPRDRERRARRIVEAMALALQGSILVRHGDPAIADAFCATRLADRLGHTFGAPIEGDRAIVERALRVG